MDERDSMPEEGLPMNPLEIRGLLTAQYNGRALPSWAFRDIANRLANNESFQLWIAGKVQDDGYTPIERI